MTSGSDPRAPIGPTPSPPGDEVAPRILVAEDDAATRARILGLLRSRGHTVVAAPDGQVADEMLATDDAIALALLDWEMPELDGDEVARRARERDDRDLYLILLTSRDGASDVIAGFDAGADDYVTKPFSAAELIARVSVGLRTVELQRRLRHRVAELEEAHREVHTLQGLLPICMHCKKIRNDDDRWERIESYLEDRSEVAFSHGLCNECLEAHYPEPDDDDDDLDLAAGDD